MDIDIGRLASAAQRSRLALRRPRAERVEIVRQLVGAHYSDEGARQQVPCNVLASYVSIVGRKLIANNPRVMLTTDDRSQRRLVSSMESWANEEIKRLHLAETIERVVLDALISVGICKVGLASPGDAASVGWNIRAGEPFAQRIDLDDFVFDLHARDFSECAFIGHRYRCPLRAALKMYGRNRDLEASDDRLYNLEGDEKVSVIGRTYLAGHEEMEDMVDLWEFYLPRHRKIVTLHEDNLVGPTSDKNKGKALDIRDWIGHDNGPILVLGMGTVPGNPMPKAPMQDLLDLHLAINNILRKLIRQAERQKEVVFVAGGADEDGNRLLQTNDGEAARIDNPDKLKAILWGGPNQANFQLFAALKDLFSWLAGNLEIMGGLGAQSKTAHQDELLNQNSSATISDMQERVLRFVGRITESLCWYWHHHPKKVMKTVYSLPSLPEIKEPRRIGPKDRREVEFEDMHIRVDPYSMQHATPQQRLAGLTQIVTQVVIPLMPLLQQSGKVFDIEEFLRLVAKYMDQPDLPDIVGLGEAPQPEPSSSPGRTMPAETTRNYVRRSQGAPNPHGANVVHGDRMVRPSVNGEQVPAGAR